MHSIPPFTITFGTNTMEQELQDVQHYATIITGCESIIQVATWGGKLTDEGRYAQSVLRLQAQDDLGAFAGTESLLDGIKKGAKKLKDWIMSLIAAVKKFITGSQNQKKNFEAEYKKIKAAYDKVPAAEKEKVEEKAKPAANAFSQVFERIITKLEAAQEAAKGETFGEVGYKPDLGTAINDMKAAKRAADDEALFMIVISLQLTSKRLDAELNSLSDKLSSFASGEETPAKNSAASKVAAWINSTTAINHSIVMNIKSANAKSMSALDAFMNNRETTLKL